MGLANGMHGSEWNEKRRTNIFMGLEYKYTFSLTIENAPALEDPSWHFPHGAPSLGIPQVVICIGPFNHTVGDTERNNPIGSLSS